MPQQRQQQPLIQLISADPASHSNASLLTNNNSNIHSYSNSPDKKNISNTISPEGNRSINDSPLRANTANKPNDLLVALDHSPSSSRSGSKNSIPSLLNTPAGTASSSDSLENTSPVVSGGSGGRAAGGQGAPPWGGSVVSLPVTSFSNSSSGSGTSVNSCDAAVRLRHSNESSSSSLTTAPERPIPKARPSINRNDAFYNKQRPLSQVLKTATIPAQATNKDDIRSSRSDFMQAPTVPPKKIGGKNRITLLLFVMGDCVCIGKTKRLK